MLRRRADVMPSPPAAEQRRRSVMLFASTGTQHYCLAMLLFTTVLFLVQEITAVFDNRSTFSENFQHSEDVVTLV